MRFIVAQDGIRGPLYWNGERWVMNRKKAKVMGKIAARKLARVARGRVEAA